MSVRDLWKKAMRQFRLQHGYPKFADYGIPFPPIREIPERPDFGVWLRLGVDPDGRTRLRWKWFHFNPHTGRWT